MKNKGITLIALIITIIILLILAGITITTLTGNNGILNQTNKAVDQSVKAATKEELELELMKLRIEFETDENLKEIYSTIGDYIKDKLKGYQFLSGSVIKYNEEEDKFSFNIEGEEATFQLNDNGNITDLTFSGTTSGGNQKDTILPVVNIISTTTNSITFYATDNIGIVSYAIAEANEQPTQWEQVKKTRELEKTITGLMNNKIYYIWVKDEAGNMSEVQMVKTVDFESLQHTISWSGTKAAISITAPSLGVQYRVGVTESWNNYTIPVIVESGTTVQFIVTDGTNVTTATSVTPRLTGLQLNYDVNTGTGTVPESQEYTHEDKVTVSFIDLPTKTGYTFNGWSTDPEANSAEYTENGTKTFKMPATNVTLYAIWMPNTETSYKVVHKQMNVTGSGYTTVATENLTGIAGESITPATKSYTGFTAPATQTTTLANDGTTTVIYNYKRNQYKFTLKSATGVDTNGSSSSGTYYYGETITIKASINSSYRWNRWTASNTSFSTTTQNTTFKMPADNLDITPKVSRYMTSRSYGSTSAMHVTYKLDGTGGIIALGANNDSYSEGKALLRVQLEISLYSSSGSLLKFESISQDTDSAYEIKVTKETIENMCKNYQNIDYISFRAVYYYEGGSSSLNRSHDGRLGVTNNNGSLSLLGFFDL